MTVRVLIADDQQLVRAGFRLILERQPGVQVMGEATNGTEAVALAEELSPDVVLMDIRMPDLDGIQATRLILANPATAGVRVVILTTFDLDEYVYDALKAGANGFLLKDLPPEHLAAAVLTVSQGRDDGQNPRGQAPGQARLAGPSPSGRLRLLQRAGPARGRCRRPGPGWPTLSGLSRSGWFIS
jgi:DNA-binding NarL/FixJ family response regulator